MWLLNNKFITDDQVEGYVGFVYLITNMVTDKKYIGKKLFKFKKAYQKNKKRKKKLVDSDWKTYYGSNAELLEDVKEYGDHNFNREILHLCKTKGTCNYYEAYEQFVRNVLLKDDYYNGWIAVKVGRTHIK